MLAIGNNELGGYLGATIECPHCGGTHVVENAQQVDTATGKLVETKTLQFYRCDKTGDAYLCGIKGRAINNGRAIK